MRTICRKFVVYTMMPLIIGMICVTGLNGDLTQIEALVPAYLLGLIVALVVLESVVVALMVGAIRYMAARVRELSN